MGADNALFLLNSMLWTAGMIAAPVLIATLVVGLSISIIQVATQVQEITLSYVPKLIAAALVLILLGPWMFGQLTQFAEALYRSVPSISG